MSGFAPLQTVAIVTSRLRRLVSRDEIWMEGLRGVLRKIVANEVRLIVGDGTAGSDFFRHAASRMKVPCRVIAAAVDSAMDGDLPLRDRAVMDAADIVYVLQLRTGGNLHRLLQERIAHRRGPIVFVDLPGLQPDLVRSELCHAGAEMWRPSAEMCRPLECRFSATPRVGQATNSIKDGVHLIVPFPADEGWDLLTHTTRSRPGPWPDESFEEYADGLMESRSDADHSTLNALKRIVSQRKLMASGRTIRGGSRMVSFTARPLASLPELHRFRPHRVHWDFEPYGLCLRREWLLSRGVQPVQYGDETAWQLMPDSERPFFQLATGDSGIDWTVEREWRAHGDLSLAELTSVDVILFVPDFEAAKSLAEVTNWPITLWPGSRGDFQPPSESMN